MVSISAALRGVNSSKQGRAKPSEYWDGCRWGQYFWAKWVDDGDLKNITLGFGSWNVAFGLKESIFEIGRLLYCAKMLG